MQVTLNIPDELASRLRPVQDQLPQILEHGLRELTAAPSGFAGLHEVLETLASLPTPEKVLTLRPSPELQARISELVAKRRSADLSSEEEQDWQRYVYVEHLVRLARAEAAGRLKSA